MKKLRLLSLLIFTMLTSVAAVSQSVNRLVLSDVGMVAGDKAQLPVALENTSEITALQFDIFIPSGLGTPTGATVAERTAKHTVGFERNDYSSDWYRVILYSADNSNIKGNSGDVLYINIDVSPHVYINDTFEISVHDAVLSDKQGDNLVTEGTAKCSVSITESPDIVLADLKLSKYDIAPNDEISLIWKVSNEGGLALEDGWREEINLVSADGAVWCNLDTKYIESALAPKQSQNREVTVKVPKIPAVSGDAYVQIKAIPYNHSGEIISQQNNNVVKSDPVTVAKMLYLDPSAFEFEEKSDLPQYALLTRSGDIRVNETFDISLVKDDDRLVFPDRVEISAGNQYVYIELRTKDNDKIDASGEYILRISADTYESIEAEVKIIDDENSILTVTPSADELAEGESISMTVAIPSPTPQDLTVYITSSSPKRFEYPSTVVIHAGETSVNFDVKAVDNNEIEVDDVFTFTLKAEGYDPTEIEIQLFDNDMPELTMTAKPAIVSENAGNDAATLTIRRLTNIDKQAVIELSDDSKGQFYYTPATVTLRPGQESATVSVGVKDNDKVDGDRVVTITAAVYSSACGCTSSPSSVGNVNVQLTVVDDDSPALAVKATTSVFSEGSKLNVLRVSRNSGIDTELTVNLSSDSDEILSYPKTVTLLSGLAFVDVNVEVLKNDITGDDSMITFTATAEGYGPASCSVIVSDKTLPDAAFADFRISGDDLEAAGKAMLVATVQNVGNHELERNTPIFVYFDDSLFGKYYTPKAIEPGESVAVESDIVLPEAVGVHTFSAVVNPLETIHELKYSNNRAEDVKVSLKPAFEATASVEQKVYPQGATVTITGKATGLKAANSKVEVYVICDDVRYTVDAVADADGAFTAEYQLVGILAGHFSVGACYPGANETRETAAFDVYGVATENRFSTCELAKGETKTVEVKVTNRCGLPISNLRIECDDMPDNCTFQFEGVKRLGADESAALVYKATGVALSEGTVFESLPVRLVSDEGLNQPFTIYYYVQPLRGTLISNTKELDVTVNYHQGRDLSMTIRNVGKGETGKISLSLPDWFTTVTPREMRSLACGDSTEIVLRIYPPKDMKPNDTVTGCFGINCADGDGLSVPFSFTFVSDETGKLVIDAVDELTFRTAEAPHVAGATVIICNPTNDTIIAQGITDDDGLCEFTLSEGKYLVKITEDHHDGKTFTTLVDAGRTKTEEAFLPYSAVTVSWNVERTEIGDEYEIETVVEFDTRVPKPVVILTLPDQRPEPYEVFPVSATNKGYVAAFDVDMSVDFDGYDVEYLSETQLDSLPALQTMTVYARLIPRESEQRKAYSMTSCLWGYALVVYYDPCYKYNGGVYLKVEKRWGECVGTHPYHDYKETVTSGPGAPTSYPGLGGYGNGGGYFSSVYSNAVDIPNLLCDGTPTRGDDGNDRNATIIEGVPFVAGPDEDYHLKYQITFDRGLGAIVRKARRGVAADGVSELVLVLHPDSKVPSAGSGVTCHWHLSEDCGKILNPDELNNVIYQAPEDFPAGMNGESRSTHEIYAYVDLIDSAGKVVYSESVPIVIERVPLVLLHGLGDNMGCWSDLYFDLYGKHLYNFDQMLNLEYPTNTSAFADNANVASYRIGVMLKNYRARGIEARKADLVGHSMGGILSRLCAQKVSPDIIHKLITVNTPHSGSEIGDLVKRIPALRPIARAHFKKDNLDAVYELGVDSWATDQYLNGEDMANTASIPIHAIASIYNVNLIEELAKSGFKSFSKSINSDFDWDVVLHFAARTVAPQFTVDIPQSDLVVSTESQLGGLEGDNITVVEGPFHCDSPRNTKVMDSVAELLTAQTSSPYFSRDGFKPADRKMFDGWFGNYKRAQARAKATAEAAPISLSAKVNGGVLTAGIKDASSVRDYMFMVNFGEYGRDLSYNSELVTDVPKGVSSGIAYVIYNDVNGYAGVDSIEFNTDRFIDIVPLKISAPDRIVEVGATTDATVKCEVEGGESIMLTADRVEFDLGRARFDGGMIIGVAPGEDNATYYLGGMECKALVTVVDDYDIFNEGSGDDEDSESICSTVTLSFKQSAYVAREAFRGTLTIENGHKENSLRDLKLYLEVRDMDGKVMSEHEFDVRAESLNGMEGALDMTSGWSLAPSAKGVATILFVPTRYAAPTAPIDYSFGGSISYVDPLSGLVVTRDLSPATLTVNPTPVIDLTYFMQRDIFGDDPLTEEVELSIPAEFALLIDNKGYGDAEEVRITTSQPQIISNDKGLAINFDILSSQINGEDASMALDGAVVTDFGRIPAGTQSYAQWWLESTLLGHFTQYDVNVNHVTGFGNPDLSLIDNASIHELIHGFDIYDMGQRKRAFLVNQVKDADDMPDHIYFTDATDAEVSYVRDAVIDCVNETNYTLRVTPKTAGWGYGRIVDPTAGRRKITGVIRESDGEVLAPDNFWMTDRTLRDGKDPLQENVLHFVDKFGSEAETYNITLTELPYTVLAVESIVGADTDEVLHKALSTLTVTFNKEIDASTFTADDVKLLCQGEALDKSQIVISKVDDRTFTVDLSALTKRSGYFVFTVQTVGITDAEGFNGERGRSYDWIQVGVSDGIEDMVCDGFRAYTRDMCIYIEASTAGHVAITNTLGQYRIVEVHEGLNVYKVPASGVYIVNGIALLVR